MATNTYVPLATQTLSSNQSSVTFSSIPSTYTDIVAIIAIPASGPVTTALRVNGDTGTNYSTTVLAGISAGANSYRESNKSYGVTGGLVSGMGANTNIICHFMNYSNTTTNKTILARGNSVTNNDLEQNVILWRSTAAINSISFIDYNGGTNTYPIGTTFSLYGVAAASVGAKATGGTIYSDDSYFYHVFNATGTFTPSQSLTADVLVVAGGGGGGQSYASGGGGAGGLAYYASQSLSATNYTCTIGGGGAGASVNTVPGASGTNSSFTGLTAAVGGGGGGSNATGGAPTGGGSGGGGSAAFTAGAAGTSGQGSNGGTGGGQAGGGGGGATAVGSTGSGVVAGNGGAGSSSYSSWGLTTGIGQNISGTYWFAGGGGGGAFGTNSVGGTGGNGGGGTGGTTVASTAGTANTGGGGGGGGSNTVGSAGGSGVVVVRYAR